MAGAGSTSRSGCGRLRHGVELAGTDDEKGYGGLSLRVANPQLAEIESDGRVLHATVAGMQTGDWVAFNWSAPPPPWPARIAASCQVDGHAWTRWVLRQEPSMQNCAFPGRGTDCRAARRRPAPWIVAARRVTAGHPRLLRRSRNAAGFPVLDSSAGSNNTPRCHRCHSGARRNTRQKIRGSTCHIQGVTNFIDPARGSPMP